MPGAVDFRRGVGVQQLSPADSRRVELGWLVRAPRAEPGRYAAGSGEGGGAEARRERVLGGDASPKPRAELEAMRRGDAVAPCREKDALRLGEPSRGLPPAKDI